MDERRILVEMLRSKRNKSCLFGNVGQAKRNSRKWPSKVH